MPQTPKLSLAAVLFALSVAYSSLAQTASPKPESWLLQSVHISGDIREGFSKNCLIVYPSGEYHRERRWQVSRDGRASFDWEPPEVFEANLTRDGLSALQAILDSPEFSSIRGAIGDTRMPELSYGPQGAVAPHESINIVTVAVSRSNNPQVFELADIDVARRQEPARAFLDWLKGIERSPAQRFASSQASNCSPRGLTGNMTISGTPSALGATPPRPIHTPAPSRPHDAPMPRPVTVELLINPDGSVEVASLQDHSRPDVAQSVSDAVRKWKFEPARLLGVPIATKAHLTIKFRDK